MKRGTPIIGSTAVLRAHVGRKGVQVGGEDKDTKNAQTAGNTSRVYKDSERQQRDAFILLFNF